MHIQWKGHASFLITASEGLRILTDPFDESVGYPLPNVAADIVTVSHQHFDHNATNLLPGNPSIIDTAGEHHVAGRTIRGIATYHDTEHGSKRGNNNVFVLELDGINICHLGDLGHILTPEQVLEIGKVDVLCVPVGGFYTIDPKEALQVVEQLQPGFVLPMHYKFNAQIKLPIAPVDEFVQLFTTHDKLRVLELDTSAKSSKPKVVVLDLT